MLSDESTSKASTKACRGCGNRDLILLKSLSRKQCPDCRRVIEWKLDTDQSPLNGSHRAGRLKLEQTKA